MSDSHDELDTINEEDDYFQSMTGQELVDHLFDRILDLQQFIVESGLTEEQFSEWKENYNKRELH